MEQCGGGLRQAHFCTECNMLPMRARDHSVRRLDAYVFDFNDIRAALRLL
jgi:hypothetical protein